MFNLSNERINRCARTPYEIDYLQDLKRIKPIELLVLVSSICCHTSTPSLSTLWSTTTLRGVLVLRGVSRLDAFSGYPVHS